MSDRRKDEGGIIILGCLVVGLLFAGVGGVFAVRALAARALVREQWVAEQARQAAAAAKLSREAQKNEDEPATATTPEG